MGIEEPIASGGKTCCGCSSQENKTDKAMKEIKRTCFIIYNVFSLLKLGTTDVSSNPAISFSLPLILLPG
jgi:hypothetical protein